jgi:antitoxin (DNA-binding transcriptional repressor) of toxin-antitoxin stability system
MSDPIRYSEISTVELRECSRDVQNRVEYGKEHIGIARHGKVAAVLVPSDWYEEHKHLFGGPA